MKTNASGPAKLRCFVTQHIHLSSHTYNISDNADLTLCENEIQGKRERHERIILEIEYVINV